MLILGQNRCDWFDVNGQVCSENMDDGAVDKLQGMVTVSWVNDDVEHAK